MKLDTIESLATEFSTFMDELDVAWQQYRARQSVVGRKFAVTARGSFAGNPSVAEMAAEDTAWQRVLDI